MHRPFEFKSRARAAGIHALVSAAVALLAGLLVFGVWYPGPYRSLAGGRDLFLLVTSVDVVLGPVLTFAVFDRTKGWRHLRWDLAVIGVIQMVALVYGLHTVFAVRPLAMVFEVDRFRLVTPNDVPSDELSRAPPVYQPGAWKGPQLLGTRAPRAGAEHNDALFKALNGVDISSRPMFWQPYEASKTAVLARARPLAMLLDHYPARSAELRERLAAMHADEVSGTFLPAMARGDWVAVLDKTGNVLGYLPIDGFF